MTANTIDMKEACESLFRMYEDQCRMIDEKNEQIKELMIYKRAMESMAKQMIHPKMTALEMAKMQLGDTND